MSYSQDIAEELQALKREAGQMLKTSSEQWQQISREKAQSLATEIKTFLTHFPEAIALEEAEIDRVLAGRMIPALATALAVGIALGSLLRRTP